MSKFVYGLLIGTLLAGLGIIPTSFLQSISSDVSAEWNRHVEIARKFNEMKELK